ncbi:hypothetical protein SCD90_13735 [Terrihabitans sp. PJ23]|uniref:Uncharacterized protein n=2 Tax=Terrihabitans rhizophilus TaxID=3092662 RepID=A0ABU4RQM3_9HYPH|nr:hypothetical protein [Terrihabitans sp. PJ23]
MDGEDASMGTLPTDTIPLANALLAVRAALASGQDRDAILLAIVEIMEDPSLAARLDRIAR